MENQAIFLETVGEIPMTAQCAAEFLMLYEQSVVLALKEKGVLDEDQCEFCLNSLQRGKRG